MNKNGSKQIRGSQRTPRGMQRKLLPLLIAGCFCAGEALANPYGAQIVNGQVGMASQGNVLTITNSPGAIINWQSFSIGAGELTRFVQQGASSTVLNRIIGQDPSQILGALQSNGRVFLVNPNGILFGQGAQVNVAGLVASTLNISNEDFLAGRVKFQAGDKAADLQNQGSITTATGGQIYLVAPNVENSGILTSPKGEVILAAGQSVHLVDGANPDLHVVVSAPDNQAMNLGQIVAESGNVGIYGALVRQRGLVSANSAVVGENGKIVFKASQDAYLEQGSVTTATGAGNGGTVKVLGQRVALTGDARIDVSGQTGGGTVLVGGDYQGKNADVPNASKTYFGRNADIRADALESGDGGKVILWADDATRAYGSISARGGQKGGNGGFVEVSGKQHLAFDAKVDTSAPEGKAGKTLLDPDTLTIVNGSGGANDGDYYVSGSGTSDYIWDVPSLSDYSVSEAALEAVSATSNVTLQAYGDIVLQSLADNELSFAQGPGNSVNFYSSNGSIVFNNLNNRIATNGGDVNMYAGGGINIGGIVTKGGYVSLSAYGGNLTTGMINTSNASGSGGSVNLYSNGALTVGAIDTTGLAGYAGDIDLSGDSGITLGVGGGLSATGIAGDGRVRLTSYYGDIRMLNGQIIRAGRLSMEADTGIGDGSGGPINTAVEDLSVLNWTSGDVRIRNTSPVLNLTDWTEGNYGTGIGQMAPGGSIVLQTSGDLNISSYGNVYSTGGDITMSAVGMLANSGMVTTTGDPNASSGPLLLTAPTSSGSSLPGGSISLTAGKMSLVDPYSYVPNGIDAGSGQVTLAAYGGNAIHVGTAATTDDLASTVELSVDELRAVKGSKLIIGSGTSGDITLMSALMSGSGGTLEGITSGLVLNSAGAITQQSGAVIGTTAVEAVGSSVNLMEANATGVVSGRATAGDFQYHTINHLQVSTVHAASGISATNAVRLVSDSSASIGQDAGSAIVAPQLALQSPGAITLNDSGNTVGAVAADTYWGGSGVGSFSMVNSTNLTVGSTIFGITSISTNNQNVDLAVPSGYFINVTQPINAGTGFVTRNEGGVITTGGAVSMSSTNPILSQTVASTSTNVIVNTTSTIVPPLDNSAEAILQTVMQPESQEQEQEQKQTSGATSGQTAEQTQSGASKNEASQKLYCN